jgi:hypothetical protein
LIAQQLDRVPRPAAVDEHEDQERNRRRHAGAPAASVGHGLAPHLFGFDETPAPSQGFRPEDPQRQRQQLTTTCSQRLDLGIEGRVGIIEAIAMDGGQYLRGSILGDGPAT